MEILFLYCVKIGIYEKNSRINKYSVNACSDLLQRQENGDERDLERMMDSEIILPTDVVRVFEGEVDEIDEDVRRKPKLLVFVDSTDCGECHISKFFRFESIKKEADSLGTYETMLLLSPKRKDLQRLIEKAKLLYMPFPVYIDMKNEFLGLNPSVPSESIYHTMYVGLGGKIKMVGDPSSSEKIKEVFDKVKDIN